MDDDRKNREINTIKEDFLDGEEAIRAIERLQALGFEPKDAEALVEHWETL